MPSEFHLMNRESEAKNDREAWFLKNMTIITEYKDLSSQIWEGATLITIKILLPYSREFKLPAYRLKI